MIIEKAIKTYIIVDDDNHLKCSELCRFFSVGYGENDGYCALYLETDDYESIWLDEMNRCQQCLDGFGMGK